MPTDSIVKIRSLTFSSPDDSLYNEQGTEVLDHASSEISDFIQHCFRLFKQAVCFRAVTLYISLNSVTGSQSVKTELGQK